MIKAEDKYYPVYIAIILILLIPALFINLGLLPLIADEATRAIVSLEMEISGNLVAPTISGEFYYNKPPLYNWMLLSFFQITGDHSEWMVRLPTVIFTLLFGITIYLSTFKYTSKRIAFISAISFLTIGRILFYDSMLGLIDMSFSMLIFLNFILIYQFAKRKNYWLLFLLSYLIAAMAFLMKGIPAVAFQGITIVSAMIFFKKWRKLFRIQHFLGLVLFSLIVGGYYILLWKENPDPNYFHTLINQSTKRTFLEYGIWKTIVHIFTFPPEQLYNLLPWSLLSIFLFKKDSIKTIQENHFLHFLALIFILNIPIYWISVETYPRYLFMLYPILIIVIVNQYYSLKINDKALRLFWIGMTCIIISSLLVGSWFYFTIDFISHRPSIILFILFLAVSALLLFNLWKSPGNRLEILIIFLLISRIGFNLIVLPERQSSHLTSMHKDQAIEVARLSSKSKLFLHPNTPISVESVYYISKERMEFLEKTNKYATKGNFYIFDARDSLREKENVIYTFQTRWKNKELRLTEFE